MTQIATAVARPRPIYVIGDAHVLAFNNLLFADETDGRGYVSYAKHIIDLNCQNTTDAFGQLHPAISKALLAEGLLTIHEGSPIATHTLTAQERAPRGEMEDPIIMLSVGHMDVRAMALSTDPNTTELFLPYVLPDAELFDGPENPQHLILWEAIEPIIDFKIGAITAAARLLLDLGFSNVFLMSIPPQTPPDGHLPAERRAPFKPSLIEYRLASVFNRTFAESAKSVGYRFVNAWDLLTLHNQVRPAFCTSGITLNRWAARESIAELLRVLHGRPVDLSFMSSVHPIIAIGDENVLPLDRRVFSIDGYEDEYQIIHSHYLPDYSLKTVVGPTGAKHLRFMEALVSDLVVWIDHNHSYATGFHTGNSEHGEIYAKTACSPRRDPPIVISCGALDLEDLRALDDGAVAKAFEPLLAGALALRGLGFSNIALRGIPENADASAGRLNTVLRAQTAARGLRYVLPTSAEDPALLDPFARLVLEGKREPLLAAYTQMRDRSIAALKGEGAALDPAFAAAFKKDGRLAVTAPRDPIAALLAGIRFGGKVNTWKSLDWCGDGLIAIGWDRAAPIDRTVLKAVSAVFYQAPVRTAIMSVMGSAFSILSVRVLRRSDAAAKREAKAAQTPPGIIKAFMHLNGGKPDLITIATVEEAFEAARALAPGAVFADFVLAPTDIWGSEITVHAGPYAWPVDPLNPVFDGAVTHAP